MNIYPFYPLRFDNSNLYEATVMNAQLGLECRLETAKEDEKDEKVPRRKIRVRLWLFPPPPSVSK